MLFYRDRRASNIEIKINGGASSNLTGALYFPTSDITFAGNSGMDVKCLQMVGQKLKFRGGANDHQQLPRRQRRLGLPADRGEAGRMRRLLPSLARDERGTSLIEFGFLAPFLALLAMGIIDLSRGLAERFAIQQAVNRSLELVQARPAVAGATATDLDYGFAQDRGRGRRRYRSDR